LAFHTRCDHLALFRVVRRQSKREQMTIFCRIVAWKNIQKGFAFGTEPKAFVNLQDL
jgi:hypothetical protein